MKETIAKALFVLGALAGIGNVLTASILERPWTATTVVLMMVPYLYLQYRVGKKTDSDDGGAKV